MKTFDFRKFLSENKLTLDSKINEIESKLDISQVDMGSLELDGFSQEDPTDLADVYIVSAQFLDGRELSDDERDELLYLIPDVIYDKALDRMSSRAEDSWDAWKDGTYYESKGVKKGTLTKSNMGEASLADYAGKWYEYLLGLENLHKYPQDFIDWLNEEDTWAETFAMKYKIKTLIGLFSLWITEKY